MKKLTCYGLLLGLIFAPALWAASADFSQLPLHIGGRVLIETNSDGNKTYKYSWPPIYFETAFKGDSLTLKFDDDQNNFQLIVDNGSPITIKMYGSPHCCNHFCDNEVVCANVFGVLLGSNPAPR